MEVWFRVCVGCCEGQDADGLGMNLQVERETKVFYGKGNCGEVATKEFLKGKGQGEGGWGWDGAVRGLEGRMGGSGRGKVLKER